MVIFEHLTTFKPYKKNALVVLCREQSKKLLILVHLHICVWCTVFLSAHLKNGTITVNANYYSARGRTRGELTTTKKNVLQLSMLQISLVWDLPKLDISSNFLFCCIPYLWEKEQSKAFYHVFWGKKWSTNNFILETKSLSQSLENKDSQLEKWKEKWNWKYLTVKVCWEEKLTVANSCDQRPKAVSSQWECPKESIWTWK